MEKLKIPAIISFIMVLTCGCSDNNHYKTLLFKHDSSRPQCRYSTDPGRVPYYSEPVVVATDWDDPVNSIYLDGEHALSPDSLQLFLTSTRPGGMGGADIWVSEKDAEGWSVPENPGAPATGTDNRDSLPAIRTLCPLFPGVKVPQAFTAQPSMEKTGANLKWLSPAMLVNLPSWQTAA